MKMRLGALEKNVMIAQNGGSKRRTVPMIIPATASVPVASGVPPMVLVTGTWTPPAHGEGPIVLRPGGPGTIEGGGIKLTPTLAPGKIVVSPSGPIAAGGGSGGGVSETLPTLAKKPVAWLPLLLAAWTIFS